MIIRGQRVSRARMAGDPFLGFVGKGLGILGKAALGGIKAQLGIPANRPQSADAFTSGAKVGTPQNPAVIQIGGTKVAFPDDPLGFGAAIGMRGGTGAGGRRGRRMRVTNVRALRRALRRVEGFGRMARRYVKIRRTFKPIKRRRR